jgi:hypothetical protein
VAIPTDFKGYTPAAGTTKSFNILGSATVGVWANDVDGTLSATSSRVDVGPNLVLFMTQAYTDAQIVVLLRDFLQRMGALHDGAGGQKADATKQVAISGTTCT